MGTVAIGDMNVESRDLKKEPKADAAFQAPTDLPLPAEAPHLSKQTYWLFKHLRLWEDFTFKL